ncbi:unnamed protein product [Acidithrix sp. C25]|nr:unnamed protein product [Acidithrix sp. C25]
MKFESPMEQSEPSKETSRDQEELTYLRDQRRLLWSLPTGLYLLGTNYDKAPHLMTTSWVSQVATSPKILMFSVEASSKTARNLDHTKTFALSILKTAQRSLIRRYVKGDQVVNFTEDLLEIEGNTFSLTSNLDPFVPDGVGVIEGQIQSKVTFESHFVFFGEVTNMALFDSECDVLSMADTKMNYGG